MDTIQLEIPPRTEYLVLVRRVVSTAARLHGALSQKRADDLRLAVTEACANAVDAEVAAGVTDPVEVHIEVSAAVVVVTVTDHAGGFSPDGIGPVPAADAPHRLGRERGLGLTLMRDVADALRFTRTADGTAVRIAVVRVVDP